MAASDPYRMKPRAVTLFLLLFGLSVSAVSSEYEQVDIYKDLRGQALALNSESLQPRNGLLVLLMETGYGDAVVTVLAAADGSASIYFSNGGGLIGAGEYEQVREVVFETLSEAVGHLERLEETDAYPLPEPGRTRFYAVTDHGVFTAEALEDLLGNDRHALSPLFHQVHKLIAYMRAADEHRRSQETE
ncbi:MAG: hypothetical protein QNJ14_14165 [Woeseiaceae bacterium]|nr:hypothetical protein [Woeseiaceae bacterium]